MDEEIEEDKRKSDKATVFNSNATERCSTVWQRILVPGTCIVSLPEYALLGIRENRQWIEAPTTEVSSFPLKKTQIFGRPGSKRWNRNIQASVANAYASFAKVLVDKIELLGTAEPVVLVQNKQVVENTTMMESFLQESDLVLIEKSLRERWKNLLFLSKKVSIVSADEKSAVKKALKEVYIKEKSLLFSPFLALCDVCRKELEAEVPLSLLSTPYYEELTLKAVPPGDIIFTFSMDNSSPEIAKTSEQVGAFQCRGQVRVRYLKDFTKAPAVSVIYFAYSYDLQNAKLVKSE